MKTKGVKLTERQKFFIAEYQKDWVGSQAVIRAGYKTKHPDIIAWQLLRIPLVKETLQRQIDERLQKIGVHAERVLTDLVRVALSDIRKLYREDGTLKPPKEWETETACAIAGLETFEEFSGKGDNRKVIGHTKKVKTYDKVKALEILTKHLNLFAISGQKGSVEVHVREVEPAPVPNLAKIVSLVKLAAERKKEVEATQTLK